MTRTNARKWAWRCGWPITDGSAAALVCYFLVEFAAGVRWWILLKVQQIHLSMSRVAGCS